MKLAPIERRTFRCTQNHFFCSGNFNMLHVNFENLTFNFFLKILKYDKSCFKFNFVQNETFTIFRYVLIK